MSIGTAPITNTQIDNPLDDNHYKLKDPLAWLSLRLLAAYRWLNKDEAII